MSPFWIEADSQIEVRDGLVVAFLLGVVRSCSVVVSRRVPRIEADNFSCIPRWPYRSFPFRIVRSPAFSLLERLGVIVGEGQRWHGKKINTRRELAAVTHGSSPDRVGILDSDLLLIRSRGPFICSGNARLSPIFGIIGALYAACKRRFGLEKRDGLIANKSHLRTDIASVSSSRRTTKAKQPG